MAERSNARVLVAASLAVVVQVGAAIVLVGLMRPMGGLAWVSGYAIPALAGAIAYSAIKEESFKFGILVGTILYVGFIAGSLLLDAVT